MTFFPNVVPVLATRFAVPNPVEDSEELRFALIELLDVIIKRALQVWNALNPTGFL